MKKKEVGHAPYIIGTSIGVTWVGIGAGLVIGNVLLGATLGAGLSAVIGSMYYHDKDFRTVLKERINGKKIKNKR